LAKCSGNVAMVILIFLCFEAPRSIPLTDPITFASEIGRIDDRLFVFDAYQEQVFRVSSSGEVVSSVGERGTGPGEFSRAVGIRLVDDSVWVFDVLRRSVVVFDLDLVFVRRLQTPILPRGGFTVAGSVFLVGYDAASRRMVHRINPDGKILSSFGRGLEEGRLMGFQSGSAILHRGRILFAHSFLPRVFCFSAEGNLLRSADIPSLEDPLVSADVFTGKGGDLEYVLDDLLIWRRKPWLRLRNLDAKKAWLYPLDPMPATLEDRVPVPFHILSDRAGELYVAHYNQDREITGLTLFDEEVFP